MTTTTSIALDDVIGIVGEVWGSYLGAELEDGPIVRATAVGERVAGSVSITGSWSGHVVVEVSLEAARRIAAELLGLAEDELEDSDVADAVGELANVVGGNIKSLLPPPNALSLPVVAWGGAALLAWPDVEDSVLAELSWGGEPLTVTVWTARADRETAVLGRNGKGHGHEDPHRR
jgi:chemotaxis protein CheX